MHVVRVLLQMSGKSLESTYLSTKGKENPLQRTYGSGIVLPMSHLARSGHVNLTHGWTWSSAHHTSPHLIHILTNIGLQTNPHVSYIHCMKAYNNHGKQKKYSRCSFLKSSQSIAINFFLYGWGKCLTKRKDLSKSRPRINRQLTRGRVLINSLQWGWQEIFLLSFPRIIMTIHKPKISDITWWSETFFLSHFTPSKVIKSMSTRM